LKACRRGLPERFGGGTDPPEQEERAGTGAGGRYRKQQNPAEGEGGTHEQVLEVGAKQAPDGEDPDLAERTLFLNGTIASESWFDDDVTPALFKSDLDSGKGPITVWINSPGGDVWAAAQIYNMLLSYTGKVTVKIDGLAASAASVIAMAGDEVLVSPVSMLMIHNPSTMAMGDKDDLAQAISMLDSVKDSILNAYVKKTGLSKNKLSSSWMMRPGWTQTRRSSLAFC
jgi:ATP-dependent protease ClpP protease subunit